MFRNSFDAKSKKEEVARVSVVFQNADNLRYERVVLAAIFINYSKSLMNSQKPT